MIHHRLNPIIFVLNNNGYTIERYLHGKTRKYNDISSWCVFSSAPSAIHHASMLTLCTSVCRKWTRLLETLGGEEGKTAKSYTVRTKQELSDLLDDATFANAEVIQLVELIMEQDDAPRGLKVQAELSGKTNRYTSDD